MGDDVRERLRRRLQRYRQHHEASRCRYDNAINNICEQQQEQTRLLHKRWLESRYSVPRKRLKLSVMDEKTTASSVTDMNVSTSQSLVHSVGDKCMVSPSDTLAVSKSQRTSVDSVCGIDTSSDGVQVSTVLLSPTVDSLISACDGITATEIIRRDMVGSQCESRPEDCYSVADSENSSEKSSSTVLSCDTVIHTCIL